MLEFAFAWAVCPPKRFSPRPAYFNCFITNLLLDVKQVDISLLEDFDSHARCGNMSAWR